MPTSRQSALTTAETNPSKAPFAAGPGSTMRVRSKDRGGADRRAEPGSPQPQVDGPTRVSVAWVLGGGAEAVFGSLWE